MAKVEVRHVRAKGAEVVAFGTGRRSRQVFGFTLEGPGLGARVVPRVLAPDVPALGCINRPHEPISEGTLRVGQRGLEGRELVRAVVDHIVHDHADAALVCLAQQLSHVL